MSNFLQLGMNPLQDALTQSGIGEPGVPPGQEPAPETPQAEGLPPAPDTIPVESTPTQEEKPKAETPAGENKPEVEPKPEEKTPDFNAMLNERFDGRFKSEDDISNLVKDYESRTNWLNPSNTHVNAINDLFGAGNDVRDVIQYLQIQAMDVDSMDSAELVRMHHARDLDLSAEELDFMMARTYPPKPTDEQREDLDPAEFRSLEDAHMLGQIQWKRDLKAAREAFKSLQKETKIPTKEERDAVRQQQIDAHRDAVQQAAKSFSGVETKIGDSQFKFEVDRGSQEDMNLMKEVIRLAEDTQSSRWINKDGSWNYDLYMSDMFKIMAYDRAVNAADARGYSRGVEELKDKHYNPTKPGGGDAPAGSAEYGEENFLAKLREGISVF